MHIVAPVVCTSIRLIGGSAAVVGIIAIARLILDPDGNPPADGSGLVQHRRLALP